MGNFLLKVRPRSRQIEKNRRETEKWKWRGAIISNSRSAIYSFRSSRGWLYVHPAFLAWLPGEFWWFPFTHLVSFSTSFNFLEPLQFLLYLLLHFLVAIYYANDKKKRTFQWLIVAINFKITDENLKLLEGSKEVFLFGFHLVFQSLFFLKWYKTQKRNIPVSFF